MQGFEVRDLNHKPKLTVCVCCAGQVGPELLALGKPQTPESRVAGTRGRHKYAQFRYEF